MRKINSVSVKLLLLSVLPMVTLGIIFIIFGNVSLKNAYEEQAAATLYGVGSHVRDEFARMYPGVYHEENGNYYAGDVNVSGYAQYLNKYKSEFKTEVTVFFDDVRVLTTLTDSNGSSMVGTRQDASIIRSRVLIGHKDYSSDNAVINGKRYHVIYMPLYSEDQVVGMVFAGISDENMEAALTGYRLRMIFINLVLVLILVFIVSWQSGRLAKHLGDIKKYLGDLVSEKSTEQEMSPAVLSLSDEVGELGRYAVKIGEEFRLLMGKDPLTGLHNRRAGRSILDKLWDKAKKEETFFSIVMGDIDHFKNVNDTFGHEYGDVVLKRISEIMHERCQKEHDSYVIRWGGEEFLLALYMPIGAAINLVTVLSNDIRKEEFECNGEKFKVTMTFGISSSKTHDDIHGIIVSADEKLYRGKDEGRDRIIF